MFFKGIRKSIVIDLVLLISLGMILMNFVLLVLWQDYAISQAIRTSSSYLKILADNVRSTDFGADSKKTGVAGEQLPFGQIYQFCNGTIEPKLSKKESLIFTTMSQCAYTNQPVTRKIEGAPSIWGASFNKVVLAYPVRRSDDCSVGVVVDLEVIKSGVFGKTALITVYMLVNLIVLTTVGFFRMRKNLLIPLEKLVEMSEAYEYDSDRFFSHDAKTNEFGHIAGSMQKMLARIEQDKAKLDESIRELKKANSEILKNQKILIETEKFAALGRITAGLAHEVGNPLGIIQGYIELLQKNDLEKDERIDYTQRALSELGRLSELVHQMLDVSRKDRDEKSIVHLEKTCDGSF